MSETPKTLRDEFAMAAMQAIISKLPLFDVEGRHGKPSSYEGNQKINREVAESAYYCADAMMEYRKIAL